MARTSSQKVKDVLMSDYGPKFDGAEPSLQPHIETAGALTSRVSTAAAARGVTLSTAELELIERWLAAHFYAVSDQPYESRMTEGAQARFQGKTGMGLTATKYGQTAILLDWSGALAAIGGEQRKTGALVWLGRPPSEQTDYVDRD